MSNYDLGNDHWKVWVESFEKLPDQEKYKFLLKIVNGGSSFSLTRIDSLDKLKEYIENRNVAVIIPWLPHIEILSIREDEKLYP